nr:MAG TPA: hypothetical protein [Bacteriophage sp.]
MKFTSFISLSFPSSTLVFFRFSNNILLSILSLRFYII